MINLPSRLGLLKSKTANNECLGYDSKESDSKKSNAGATENAVVAPGRVLSMGQIKLNSVRIAWNRTVLTLKSHTYD